MFYKKLQAAIAVMLLITSHLSPAVAASRPKVGEMAPEFELTLVDGSKVKLSDLRGQVVILNFWATWCAPCRVELPTLDGYYRMQGKHGLKVFAITTEGSVPNSKLKELFAAMKIPAVKRIKGRYANIEAVPTNFIIDRAGKLRFAKAQALDLDDLNSLVVPLLNEAPPA